MNLQAKKLELVQLIINTRKPLTLKKVEEILKKEKESDWYEIGDAERQSIEKGLQEAGEGKLIPHEEVMKEAKAKYKELQQEEDGNRDLYAQTSGLDFWEDPKEDLYQDYLKPKEK
jgi:predicted Zn-ribbon and HTH transcriptional regulator